MTTYYAYMYTHANVTPCLSHVCVPNDYITVVQEGGFNMPYMEIKLVFILLEGHCIHSTADGLLEQHRLDSAPKR